MAFSCIVNIMKIKIEILDDWLTLEEGSASLHIQSCKEDHNRAVFYERMKDVISELINKSSTDEIIKFLSSKEFYHLSFVFKSTDVIVLKTDIVRSVPLFYSLNNNQIFISDKNNPNDKYELNKESIIQMVELGYVLGDQTVYKNVFGAQAAEIIVIKKDSIHKDRFFKYDIAQESENKDTLDVNRCAIKLDKIFTEIFQEIVESIPKEGRIIVPLSGGHDSRMIVNYLYKIGFKDVLCYSYGIPDNIQSELSRQVANALGYDWHFIEYTEEKWEELHKNGDFDNFIDYSFNGVSNPHFQDFLAVYELKKTGALKPGDVFIPGHGLDILSTIENYLQNNEDIISEVVKRFSRSSEISDDMDEVLHNRYASIFENSAVSKNSFIDYLFWQERAAKFTVNSLQVYKFYGYATRLPFWDIRLINFWLGIDLHLKKTQAFLIALEKECLLARQIREIPFATRKSSHVKNKKDFKDYVPDFLKILYLRMSKRKQPQSEGLNLIYNKKAKSVSELMGSTDRWPDEIINSIGLDLKRYPFQINHHFLTRLYTVNKLLNTNDSKEGLKQSLRG